MEVLFICQFFSTAAFILRKRLCAAKKLAAAESKKSFIGSAYSGINENGAPGQQIKRPPE